MQPAPQTGQAEPYKPPRKGSIVSDGRRAEARVFRQAEAELLALAGDQPSDLQRRWVRQAASLQAMMHALSREASGTRVASIQRAAAYTAASRQYTALVDRIVRGAPDRKHERQDKPEAPEMDDLHDLADLGGG